MERISLAQKLFTEFVERAPLNQQSSYSYLSNEGIIKSVNEFIDTLVTANNVYNKEFQIPSNKQLVFAEEMPGEQLAKLNNDSTELTVQDNTLNDIRVITYLANEKPAIISQRKADGEDGIRNIKWKPAGYFDDPEFTGYSIVRYSRDIEANITFKVWGRYFQDIRERAKLLRSVIDTNVWYFKHKGLRDIIWLGSNEEEVWDNKNVAKYKTEYYRIRFSEIREFREKNLEQIVAQFGLA